MTSVDERVSQFYLSVGRLCADARLGGLTMRITLADGTEIIGVPQPPRETEGVEQLDAIGYADEVTVDGVTVALSDVVAATVSRPRTAG